MTTPYAQRAPQEQRAYTLWPQLRAVTSAPGQGREARKVRENVRAICFRTTQGHSAESEALKAAVRDLAESIEALQDRLQGVDITSYNHVPLKAAFSVKATYRLSGKMSPRQLPEVE
jgi:hypothetical protein